MKLLLSRYTCNPAHEYASLISDHKQLGVEHCHDYFELFLVHHGSASHRVNGTTQPLIKGTVVFVRPEDTHSYTDMSSDFEIINMLLPCATINSLFEYLGEGFNSGRLIADPTPPMAQLSFNDYKSLVQELEQLVLSKKILKTKSDAIFRITLMRIIVKCFPIVPEDRVTQMPVWLRWLTLEMMKKENFSEGLPAMQRLSGKSKEYIARSCRKFLHKSPTEFINELRVEYSARAIMFSGEKIIDICAEVGFESLSHYYHLFKKIYGVAPSRFRDSANIHDLEEKLYDTAILESGIPPAMSL